MDAVDLDRIERAQACLWQVRAEYSGIKIPSLVGELTHHLDMLLRVVTGIRVMSGELDHVELAVTPRPRVPTCVYEDDGQRTVMTVESDIAAHE
jgi:hypothetical protein